MLGWRSPYSVAPYLVTAVLNALLIALLEVALSRLTSLQQAVRIICQRSVLALLLVTDWKRGRGNRWRVRLRCGQGEAELAVPPHRHGKLADACMLGGGYCIHMLKTWYRTSY